VPSAGQEWLSRYVHYRALPSSKKKITESC
jgi:hypothetical protein